MRQGERKRSSSKRKLVESLSRRPFLTIFIAWLVVYIPLVIIFGMAFPEEHNTVKLSDEHVTARDENSLEMFDNLTDTMVRVYGGNLSEIRVMVPDGYIPMRLEVSGYGKVYTSSPYDENRTWELAKGEIINILNRETNSTITVEVYKKETDAPFYKDRGETLIEGRMIYVDVPTMNPPLINLFWIPPALLGGSFLVFRAYFALFALFSSLLLMRTHIDEGKWTRVKYGAFLLFNPLTIYSTTGAVQDDIIIAFLFLVAINSLVRNRRWWAAAVIGLGMATKIFQVLMLPGQMSAREPVIDRFFRTGLSVAIAVAILAPFAFISPDGVMTFIKLYFTGDSGDALQGISLWRYLGEIGYYPFINTVVLLFSGLFLFSVTFAHEMKVKRTSLLFILLFLLLFPKIHSGYYLMLFAFIPLLWNVKWMRTVLIVLGTSVIGLDLMNGQGWTEGNFLIAPLLLSAAVVAIVAFFFLNILQEGRREAKANRRPRL